jgi:predicted  nucleic acid-binding Zn-ribbon protein
MVYGHIILSSVFLLLAAAGWGAFAYTLRNAQSQESDIRSQIQRVTAEREQLVQQNSQLQAGLGRHRDLEQQLTTAREQLAASGREITALARALEQAQADLKAARSEITALREQPAAKPAPPEPEPRRLSARSRPNRKRR